MCWAIWWLMGNLGSNFGCMSDDWVAYVVADYVEVSMNPKEVDTSKKNCIRADAESFALGIIGTTCLIDGSNGYGC